MLPYRLAGTETISEQGTYLSTVFVMLTKLWQLADSSSARDSCQYRRSSLPLLCTLL
jgi:hypothetical protein